MKVRSTSEDLTRKCDTLFQQIFYLIHNGRKKTPLHVSLTQSIHDKCQSKQLMQILNNLGMCVNYEEMLRTDYNLADRLIRSCGENKVPLPESITSTSIMHASIDNFDHIENGKSGKGSSHDTIMMLFENNESKVEKIFQLSNKPNDQIKKRSITQKLKCQMIKTFLKAKRGQIPSDFDYTSPAMPGHVINFSRTDFISTLHVIGSPWTIQILISHLMLLQKSFVSSVEIIPTLCTFTPRTPHLATQFENIFTCMKNFQDVLLQKNFPHPLLWSDEGVYRISKEIQLLEKVVPRMYLLKQKYLDQLLLTVFWMESITHVQSEIKVLLYEVLLQKILVE